MARPVRWIVGYGPGGPNDILARLMGQWLSERLGQPFFIENRPGAGGNIGTEAAVRALADGYTLLSGTAQALHGARTPSNYKARRPSICERNSWVRVRLALPIGSLRLCS